MIKLRYASTSPFVRKVIVVAAETGQLGEIEHIPTKTADPASNLVEQNPLGKIPTAILENGIALYDSRVICEWLDHRGGGKLFPTAGPVRWMALRRQALADGIGDAAVLRMGESRRPENLRSRDFDLRQSEKVSRGLNVLEGEAISFGETVDIGTLTTAIVLDYLDFRFAAEDWRQGRSNLANWHRAFSTRPSLIGSMPHE